MPGRIAGALVLVCLACASPGRPVAEPTWTTAWACALQDYNETITSGSVALTPNAPMAVTETTLRQDVWPSVAGDAVRVHLSNRFGHAPLHVAAAHIADAAGGGQAVAGTDQTLTFAGQGSVTLAAGEEAWSDALPRPVHAGKPLAVSLYVPGSHVVSTVHLLALQSNWQMPGDAAAQATWPQPSATTMGLWVDQLLVRTPQAVPVLVAFGDSLTDGAESTLDGQKRWPDALLRRLRAAAPATPLAVVNMGVGGNRWLHDGIGPAGLARLAHDVLEVEGASHVVVFMGVNDIGIGLLLPAQAVSAAQLTAAMRTAVDQARSAGLQVALATLLPFEGAFYYTDEGEATRVAVNTWIRAQTDVVVLDLDAALRDPAQPTRLDPAVDSGDHLHLNDADYQKLAASVPLGFLGIAGE